MVKNIQLWISLLIFGVLAACSGTAPKPVAMKGLVTGQPGMNIYTDKDPGETLPLPRAYEMAPPVVPHSVSGLAITLAANDCIDCHMEGDEVDDGHIATRIPESHLVNKFTGERASDGVVGVRYNCLQCHVPQANAPSFFSQN